MFKLALHWQIFIGMVVGAAVGLLLNLTLGQRHVVLSGQDAPAGYTEVEFDDTVDRIEIRLVPEQGPPRTWVVGSKAEPGAVSSLEAVAKKDPAAVALFRQYGRSWARWAGDLASRIGGLFLRLLKMVSIPLIVTSLATGVMGLGHAGHLGRMFSRTLVYYLATSMLAIVTGLLMVNLIRPGLGQNQLATGEGEVDVASGTLGEVLFEQVETLIPTNPLEALSSANFLSIISFTLIFSIFTLRVGGRTAEYMRDFFTSAFDVMMAMTMAIIYLAPYGVLFLMIYVTATQGLAVFQALFWYMLAVLLALAFHSMITLPLILRLIAKRSPAEFARAMSPALLTAFSSASSNGTLPLTMASVEQRAGVSNRVSSFVLPLGATINMDGTALYEAVAVLFIAQLYHGGNLPLGQQVIVAFTALLASVGAAGIPHAGLVMMTIILQAVGLPVEMQGIILAVDRVLDMCRTSVNVWSDSCGCAVIAQLERS